MALPILEGRPQDHTDVHVRSRLLLHKRAAVPPPVCWQSEIQPATLNPALQVLITRFLRRTRFCACHNLLWAEQSAFLKAWLETSAPVSLLWVCRVCTWRTHKKGLHAWTTVLTPQRRTSVELLLCFASGPQWQELGKTVVGLLALCLVPMGKTSPDFQF